MRIHFLVLIFGLIDIAFCFGFEGSGDEESSFSLTAEELIPFEQRTTPAQPSHRKKSKHRPGRKKPKNRDKDRIPHRKEPLDLCKSASCSQLCSLKNGRPRCSCRQGFILHRDAKSCIDVDECSQLQGYCEHMCVNTPGSFHCACHEHYRLRKGSNQTCESTCDPPCLNNGVCIGPNKCKCPFGYAEPGCTPVCIPPCANGGSCKRWNVCKCAPHYDGPTCLNAICSPPCLNRGRCVAPNTCTCRSGFHGKRCEKRRCIPPCKNGGTCGEKNICYCRSGYAGARCQAKIDVSIGTPDVPSEEDVNPKNASERNINQNCFPTRANCYCRNRTVTNGHCPKPTTCQLISVPIQVTKMVRMHFPETYLVDCGTGSFKRKCVRARYVVKITPRSIYRRAYRMQCYD